MIGEGATGRRQQAQHYATFCSVWFWALYGPHRSLFLSGPQFPHLYDGQINVGQLKVIQCGKALERCQCHFFCSLLGSLKEAAGLGSTVLAFSDSAQV